MTDKKITSDDYVALSKQYGVEYAAIRAFVDVESGQKGFYDNGAPVILFEGHIFYKLLPEPIKSQTAKNYPNLCYPVWTTKFYSFSSLKRLAVAAKINEKVALMSCSWGLMQVMGFNYSEVGYKTVHDFVEAMAESEYKQVKAGIEYLVSRNLIGPLKQRKWAYVALRYNGKGYRQNKYDTKLAERYNYWLTVQKDLIEKNIL